MESLCIDCISKLSSCVKIISPSDIEYEFLTIDVQKYENHGHIEINGDNCGFSWILFFVLSVSCRLVRSKEGWSY